MKKNEKVLNRPSSSSLSTMPKAQVSIFAAASVGRLSNLFPRWMSVHVEKEHGIASSRLMIMWILLNEGSLPIGQLAKLIDLTPRALTRIVDGLESNGYAMRKPEKTDKRAVNVELTKNGRAFFDEIVLDVTSKFESLFNVLDKREMVELSRIIEKLTDHMKSQIT